MWESICTDNNIPTILDHVDHRHAWSETLIDIETAVHLVFVSGLDAPSYALAEQTGSEGKGGHHAVGPGCDVVQG